MSDYADRIQALRTRVSEIEHALSAFRRQAERLPNPAPGTLKVAKMVRFTDEGDFTVLLQKVTGLQEELNLLEAEVDEEVQDLTDEQEFYPPEV